MTTTIHPAPDILGTWSSRDSERVAQMYAADGVRHQYAHPSARLHGRDEIAEAVQAIFDAFPDSRIEIRAVNQSATGAAIVEWTWTGTQTGDLPGLPARGKALHLEGVSVCEMDGQLIREERVYWDNAAHLAAQGLLG